MTIEIDLGDLRKKSKRFGEDIADLGTQVAQKIALDILGDVVETSPVDTGRFRASWLVSIDGPDPSKVGGENPDSPVETVGRGEGEIVRFGKDNVSITIQNNLDYAAELEYGSSQQAPQGVLSGAINRATLPFRRGVQGRFDV